MISLSSSAQPPPPPPPLTPSTLLTALHSLSQPSNIQQSQNLLLHWEQTQPTIYANALLSALIFQQSSSSSSSTDNSIAMAATLSLKACIKRHWKATIQIKKTKMIPLEEECKEGIRMELLRIVCDANVMMDVTLARNIASLLSLIGRYDLPRVFPTLIPTLIQSLATSSDTSSTIPHPFITAAALTLYQLLDELSRKRLPIDKKYLSNVAEVHLPVLTAVILRHISSVDNNNNNNANTTNDDNDNQAIINHLQPLLKCLGLLVTSSWIDYNGRDDLIHACFTIIQQMTYFNTDNINDGGGDNIIIVLGLDMARLILLINHHHPNAFIRHLLPSLTLFHEFLLTRRKGGMSSLSLSFFHRTISHSSNNGKDDNEEYIRIVWNYLTQEKILELGHLLLECYIPLSNEDILSWRNHPEECYNEILTGGRTLEGEEEDCCVIAQNLFLALLEYDNGRQVLGWRLVQEMRNYEGQMMIAAAAAGEEGNKVLYWEALYTIVGASCHVLIGHENGIDFNEWFEKCALVILSQAGVYHQVPPLLAYRLIWLIGCQIHLLQPSHHLPLLQRLIPTTSPQNNDIPTLLATIQTLTSLLYEDTTTIIVSSYQEQQPPSPTLQFLSQHKIPLIGMCYNLVDNLSEWENQSMVLMFVISLLSRVVVVVVSDDISTVAMEACYYLSRWDIEAIVSPLPPMGCCYPHLQCDVLSLLGVVVVAAAASRNKNDNDDNNMVVLLSEYCFPLLRTVFGDGKEQRIPENHLFLVGEALLLWCRLLRMSDGSGGVMMTAFDGLGVVLVDDFEYLRLTMLICESYIWLSPTLPPLSSTISTLLHQTIGQIRSRAVSYVTFVLEALLIKFHRDGAHLLEQNGIAAKLIQSCATKSEDDVVIVQYLMTLGRMILCDMTILDDYFPLRYCEESKDGGRFLERFGSEDMIKLYFELFQTANYGPCSYLRQKFFCIFCLSLLVPPTTRSIYTDFVVKELDSVLNICFEFFRTHYAAGGSDEPRNGLVRHAVEEDGDYEEELSGGIVSGKHYDEVVTTELKKDIVNTIDMKLYLKDMLQRCATSLGQETYYEVLSTVEPVLLQQLEKFVT